MVQVTTIERRYIISVKCQMREDNPFLLLSPISAFLFSRPLCEDRRPMWRPLYRQYIICSMKSNNEQNIVIFGSLCIMKFK